MALNCGPLKPKVQWDLEDHIRGTIYGNCIGDAIGLLSEFMVKSEAETYYKKNRGKLEYKHKVADMHRARWEDGDWTDDSDQMILIMDSICDNHGQVNYIDYGHRLLKWAREGFKELGDLGGMGLGATTHHVLRHPKFQQDPHVAAEDVWRRSGCHAAPNGAAMRTSVLGVYQYCSLPDVISNTLKLCKVTHVDPRCQATVVAITTAIALMLQRPQELLKKNGDYKVDALIMAAFEKAKETVPDGSNKQETIDELQWHMFVGNLSELKLDEHQKIGYTYKALGAGFWALRQKDFRKALEAITFEAGDADSNGAVAGALLGCKLGASALPSSWLGGLVHKEWLDKRIDRFLNLMNFGPDVARMKPSTGSEQEDQATAANQTNQQLNQISTMDRDSKQEACQDPRPAGQGQEVGQGQEATGQGLGQSQGHGDTPEASARTAPNNKLSSEAEDAGHSTASTVTTSQGYYQTKDPRAKHSS